jgi:hypothetical protein
MHRFYRVLFLFLAMFTLSLSVRAQAPARSCNPGEMGVGTDGHTQYQCSPSSTWVAYTNGQYSLSPSYSGSAFPSTCQPGTPFVRTDQTAGQNLYVCNNSGSGFVLTSGSGSGTGAVNVKDYGAKGDGLALTSCSITATSTTVTCSGTSFTTSDVGKVVDIVGAGSSGPSNILSTSISAVASNTSITVANAATNTVSGAAGNYGTDDTAALNAAFTAAYTGNKSVLIPTGTYEVSGTVADPGVAVWMDPQALLQATALNANAVFQYGNVTTPQTKQTPPVYNMSVDANNLANIGQFYRTYQDMVVFNTRTFNWLVNGFQNGDSTLVAGGFRMYGFHAYNTHTAMTLGTSQNGSSAVYIQGDDSKFFGGDIEDGQVGVTVKGGGELLEGLHVWYHTSRGTQKYSYEDWTNSGNIYVQDEADTPNQYGWYMHGVNASIVSPRCFNGTFGGTDNSMVCFHFAQTAPFATITAPVIAGTDSSHRIAKDWDGATGNLAVIGETVSNVVSTSNNVFPTLKPTSLTIGGDSSMTSAPRLTWSSYGTCSSQFTPCNEGATWTPGKPINITQWTIQVGTAPSACTTNGVVSIYQNGTILTSITLANGQGDYLGSGFPTAVNPANGPLRVRITTAAAGCSTYAAAFSSTMEYTMQ